MIINHCPSTLAKGFESYSPSALKNLFFGKKVSHILDFDAPEIREVFKKNTQNISLSGYQFKQSLRLGKNKLRLTQEGESGQYILKPIPSNPAFEFAEEIPANEHLTMQIAKQIYEINTAESALIFFKNGKPAYLTKRFDFEEKGKKIRQEDFATLLGKSKQKNGDSYKNEGSYEDLAQTLKKYVGAYLPELEKLFALILFNYLFNNGDAHLKNFSLQASKQGDFILSPSYDLLNTRLHLPNDTVFALEDGLFEDYQESESFENLGFPAYDDFYEFALKIELKEKRFRKILDKYRTKNSKVIEFIESSFLGEEAKKLYENYYLDRLKALNNSFSGRI